MCCVVTSAAVAAAVVIAGQSIDVTAAVVAVVGSDHCWLVMDAMARGDEGYCVLRRNLYHNGSTLWYWLLLVIVFCYFSVCGYTGRSDSK